ncbi:isochorismatase family protein [Lipomyces kononenkoae]|uniref:Isochorismatase family protein n=1 Tax=Lipomyces kononenkoae TaxID=34357 RepID=A0ACC3T000_LIPKO
MNTALLVIDVQQSLLDEGPWQAEAMLANIAKLVSAARVAKAPIIYITDRRVQPNPALHASLQPSSSEASIEKSYCDSFIETRLEEELTTRKIERLIIAGMQTDYCIDTTCRSAAARGYTIVLIGDAHSTVDDGPLSAEQVIAHHNRILDGFAAGDGSISVTDTASASFA